MKDTEWTKEWKLEQINQFVNDEIKELKDPEDKIEMLKKIIRDMLMSDKKMNGWIRLFASFNSEN